MFSELFSYNPTVVAVEQREQMAGILRARGEILRASAEVSDLRARAWAGEVNASDLADLKGQDLALIRTRYIEQLRPFLSNVVDLEQLHGLLPMVVMAALQSFNVPFPVVLEALGVDVDNLKLAADAIKELIDSE